MALNVPNVHSARLLQTFSQRLSAQFDRWATLDPKSLPIIGKLPAEQRTPTVSLVLLAALLLTAGAVFWHTRQVNDKADYVSVATRLQMLSQRYSKTAQQAVLGNKAAFAQLEESRKNFAAGLNSLIDGGELSPASPGSIQPELAELQKRWEVSKQNIQALTAQQGLLVAVGQSLQQINASNRELLDLTQQVLALLPDDAPRQIAFANQLTMWSQRIAKNANTMVATDLVDPEAAYQFGTDTETFRLVLDGMLKGKDPLATLKVSDQDTVEKLQELDGVFAKVEAQAGVIMKNVAKLAESKRAAKSIFDEGEKLLAMTQRLTASYEGLGTGFTLLLTVLFSIVATASLILLGILNVADARRRAEEAARESKRNQDAILRLLNEMGDLAEGDLTVQATVTEDITGAIADSVNYAIEELRMLVTNINRAAAQVTVATDEAKQVSDELLAAAERQSQQIAETGEAINRMSQSIVDVSQNAAKSTQVAEQSLATAKKGGDSVRSAIAGMNALREQIQETSKRIKRLGESSQEIGEIVELISDITEQTNVLALNAAIQAAAAGEAGRGFTVVAEEVQRLAERSGQATRRIGAIVKTIQSDTQDAVNAMEVSTQGVVQGTSLSDAAGNALQEIESVSEQLARLIQNISEATRGQAQTAENISGNMKQILQITQQASAGARRSAQSIGELAGLSEELKVSVSGFKL